MIGQQTLFKDLFDNHGWTVVAPKFEQTLSEDELVELVPQFDGWIIGDDPATERVVIAGSSGRLRAAVKWGVGTDNVNFDAFAALEIPVANTPGMFGSEVADIATGYVIGLARETFLIDREVRVGHWPKPSGISLAGKKVGVVGFGDIGTQTVRRLSACGMSVAVYDPFVDSVPDRVELRLWPTGVGDLDFIVFTCALTEANRFMLNEKVLANCKMGVRIVNVARGPLIDEASLIEAQKRGHVHSCALDVFESEPLALQSPLKDNPRNILGSHNASNTIDAVVRTSAIAIEQLATYLAR
ncbi:MAG: phosphoglycerate dehydrogenase [Pseudomonadales bacterium]|nr:phosphoglycerate dehydrogenase [Pseudomonadales bacterium]